MEEGQRLPLSASTGHDATNLVGPGDTHQRFAVSAFGASIASDEESVRGPHSSRFQREMRASIERHMARLRQSKSLQVRPACSVSSILDTLE